MFGPWLFTTLAELMLAFNSNPMSTMLELKNIHNIKTSKVPIDPYKAL
jgi:hypothetical protein